MEDEKKPEVNAPLMDALKKNSVDVTPKDVKIPLGTIRRILKQNGIGKASDEAVIELQAMINDIIVDLSRTLVSNLNYRKGKILERADINHAIKSQ
jgi:histone H3/H4